MHLSYTYVIAEIASDLAHKSVSETLEFYNFVIQTMGKSKFIIIII